MSNGPAPPRIVVLGGINMDLIGVTARMPAPGETVAGERFYTAPGGKGANQAVAAARLGAQVSMVGRVGEDEFGPPMITDLRSHGIDVAGIAVDPDNSSGIAIILLDSDRQNHIIARYTAPTPPATRPSSKPPWRLWGAPTSSCCSSRPRRRSRWRRPNTPGRSASGSSGTRPPRWACRTALTSRSTSWRRTRARRRRSRASTSRT